MKTLGKNADNDLYLEAGGLAILHDADAQCAVIEAILQTQQGELQFDEDRGIDYFGTVLQSPTYIDFWAAQVQEKILELDFVSTIEDFEYRFDSESSTLYWSMTVVNTDDDRLDLKNKKTVINGSPGIDISWNDIYDKPTGVLEALDMVEDMHEEAVDTREKLTPSSTLRETKDLIDKIVFDPNNEEYAQTRLLTFGFSGVPLGSVIDFSNIRLDIEDTGTSGTPYYAPFIVEISDGLKLRADQTITVAAVGNKIVFLDTDRGVDDQGHYYTTQKHTLMQGGNVTVTIRGNITKLWVADTSKPIFLTSKGEAFQYLSKFVVGERVPLTEIGDGAFQSFNNLQKIEWNEGDAESIMFGDYAFKDCASMRDITWLPKNLTSFGVGCFQGCSSLVSLKGLDLTKVTSVPDDSFYGCQQLQTLEYLPDNLSAIGARVFKGCKTFKNINDLPQTVRSLGTECFSECTGMTDILYPPEALESIGDKCFEGCTALESLYLSGNVTSMGDEAFKDCTALTNILSESSAVPSITESTFDGENPIVYVPANLLGAYQSDSVWGTFVVKKFGVYEFSLEDIASRTTLLSTTSNLVSDSVWTISFGDGDKPQRFIPSVDTLPSHTYVDAVASATITIKGYVRRISAASSEMYPFFATEEGSEFTNLTDISITDSPLEMIGDYAFAKCTKLVSIDCGFEEERPYCLGERAFWGCSTLSSTAWLKAGLGLLVKEVVTTYEEQEDGTIVPVEEIVYYPAFGNRCFWQSGITSIDYAVNNVKELPEYCFAETKITSLEGMQSSVLTALGEYCFYGCKNLHDISALHETGITTLPDYCFAECWSYVSPLSLNGIENLTSEGMGSHVFENSRVEHIGQIASAPLITEIAPYMFAGCGLASLIGLTNKITALGEGCFSGNALLTDIKQLLGTGVTAIPDKCFQGCTMLNSLIGCWNITAIGEYAFSGCTGLLATSGMGTEIDSIGGYAFQNCTGLKQVSCVALSVPTIASTAFDGVTVGDIPLYVREDTAASFASATTWNSFNRIRPRTIRVHLEDIGGTDSGDVNITPSDASNTGIAVSIDPEQRNSLGVWYVDYGDGSDLAVFYSTGTSIQNAVEGHQYETRGNYDITIFGDVFELWGSHGDAVVNGTYNHDIMPENMNYAPFLGTGLASHASSIYINSEYLVRIGNFCFFNYGQSNYDGNENSLSVYLNMASSANIGDYAFAKKSYDNGPIGTIQANTASTVGDYAFYKSGLDSSTPFGSLETAGKYSFAYNPGLLDIVGFVSLTEVAEHMFTGCTGLTTTTGLTAATGIDEYGFSDCTGLSSVRDFNDSFAFINDYAFAGCPNIKTVFMANMNAPELAEHGFEESVFDSAIVYVPAGKESVYESKEYWTKFTGEPTGRIRSRSISFTMNVTAGARTGAGMAIVTSTGNWVLSYGDGEQSYQFGAGDTSIPSYTFKSTGTKTIKISGPITAIRSDSYAYPIFGQSKGKNPWLTHVETSDAMEITEIGDNLFRGCSELLSVTYFPSAVAIGEYAFENDTKLTDVSGLSNVASIETYAFSGCTALPNLYGMSSVTTIGERAFNGCLSLRAIDGLGTGVSLIGDSAFASCPLNEVQMFAENPPIVAANSFSGLDVSIPLYVRTKSLSAYKEDATWKSLFPNIRSRYIEFTLTACPAGIKVWGGEGKVASDTFWVVDWDAYEWNSEESKPGLSPKYLPEHTYVNSGNHTLRIEGAVTGISADAPTVVTDPEQENEPTSITGNSFITLSLSGSNQPLVDGAHYLTRVSRSDYSALVDVGDSAFLHNGRLSAAYLSGIKTIGKGAFAYDTAITSLTMLDTAGVISKYAFYGCSGLTNIVGLNGNTDNSLAEIAFTIDDYAFGGIPNLMYIQVGVPVSENAEITDYSFGRFESAQAQKAVYAYVPLESVASYTQNAMWNKFTIASQVLTFTMKHVPTGTTIQGISDTNASGNARIVSSSRWTVDWDDGSQNTMESNQTSFPSHTYVYDASADSLERERWEMINGVMCRKQIDISITGSISSISCQSSANYPFLATTVGSGNPYLTSIEAPASMASLEQLGDFVFQGCTALESVTGFSHVKSIGQYAFSGCSSLSNLGDADTGFNAVTSIGNKAFADCISLQTLAAFPSVVSIGIRAFENCISLNGTTGMGKTYENWGINQEYSNTYSIGDDISTQSWYNPSANFAFPSDVTRNGWKRLRVGYNNSGIITSLNWVENVTASFGAYAFTGCGFGAIDMYNYTNPPNIQNSTFPGNPDDVLVFVSPESGVLEAYRAAPVWARYFDNIIAASSFSFTIEAGKIRVPTTTVEPQYHYNPDTGQDEYIGDKTTVSGTALYGANGRMDFVGQYVLIDWGDGTTTTKLNDGDEEVTAWQFPNHIYSSGVSGGAVTVNIRGDISKIYTSDAFDTSLETDETPVSTMKPFIGLAQFTTVTDPTSDSETPVTTIDDTEIDYSFTLGIEVGSNSKLARIGTYCFHGSNIAEVILGRPSENSGLEIGDCAFWNCNLSSMNISAEYGSIKSVGAYSFAGCTQLGNVDFLEGAKTIGYKAFYGCQGITEINLTKTVESVCESAFEGCYGINGGISWEQATESSILDNGNIKIGARAFYGCTGQNNESWSLVIPSQVHKIEKSAFFGCGMNAVTWGSSTYTSSVAYEISDDELATGEPGIFENCTKLSSVTFLVETDTVPSRCFCRCNGLTSVSIGSAIVTIRPYAFFGCSSLTNASLASVIANASGEIGNYAFAGCTSIDTVAVPSTVTALGEGCFNRSSEDFFIGNYEGSDSFNAGPVPDYWGISDFESWMTEHYGNKRTDVWAVYDGICLVEATDFNPLNVSWDAQTGSIGAGCFMNCHGLDIDWDNFPSLVKVPSYCFYNCQNLFINQNLAELPSTITSFGRFSLARTGMNSIGRGDADEAISASLAPALFLGCTNLQSLGDSTDGLTTLFSTIPSAIPDACFYGCTNLADIDTLAANFPSIKRLGKYCFANCQSLVGSGMHSITDALVYIEQIDDGCFMGCTGIKQFHGLYNVSYYPYQAFANCRNMSQIHQLCSVWKVSPIKYEGEILVPVFDDFDDSGTKKWGLCKASDLTTHIAAIGLAEEPYNVDSISWSNGAYTAELRKTEIMLEGDSFAGCPFIWMMNFPYGSEDYPNIVQVTKAVGYNGTEDVECEDPFSGISIKSRVQVQVPVSMVLEYQNYKPYGTFGDKYWMQFSIVTEIGSATPALRLTMNIPAGGGSIWGNGYILKDIGSGFLVDWGDGSEFDPIPDSSADPTLAVVAGMTHTYAAAQFTEAQTITLTIYGEAIEIAGEADHEQTSVLARKVVKPIFANEVVTPDSPGDGAKERNTWAISASFAGDSLTTIGDGCLGYCTNLQMDSDSIPDTVTSFGANAFFGCASLANLNFIPQGIESIGGYCFAWCENLTDFTGITDCNNLTLIPAGCFTNVASSPAASADAATRTLNWLPKNIEEIGFSAFYKFQFKNFSVISGMTGHNNGNNRYIKIGAYSFRQNYPLVSFTGINMDLTGGKSKGHAFRQCSSLTSLSTLTTNSNTIPTSTFADSGINTLVGMPSTITTFGESAFANCKLSDLDGIPTGVSSFGIRCFEGCKNLVDISGIEGTQVTSLPDYCFANCTSLEQIVEKLSGIALPSRIDTIGEYCFQNCTQITFIKLAKWQSTASRKITYLGDTNSDTNVFPYADINENTGFQILVPSGSLSAYLSEWGTSNRFDNAAFSEYS